MSIDADDTLGPRPDFVLDRLAATKGWPLGGRAAWGGSVAPMSELGLCAAGWLLDVRVTVV